jgi:hypothetical protein
MNESGCLLDIELPTNPWNMTPLLCPDLTYASMAERCDVHPDKVTLSPCKKIKN